MPIYEYECSACGHRYEKMVRIGGEPPPCPDCASAEVRKLISRSGFILQGGGWYKDHYGLKSGGSSSETKSESKSETKSSTPTSSDGGGTKAAAAK